MSENKFELLDTGVIHANISLGKGLAWLLGFKDKRKIVSIKNIGLKRQKQVCNYCNVEIEKENNCIKLTLKTNSDKYFTVYSCKQCWSYIPKYLERVGLFLTGEIDGWIDEFSDFLQIMMLSMEYRENRLYPEDKKAF